MSIDYDRLRELRDKSTPSPWKFHEEQEWEHVAGPEYPPMLTYVEHTVEGSDGGLLFGNFNDTVLEEHPDNLRLAALAPDMARELLRLRDGVERAVNTAKRQIALTIKAGHVEENGPTCPALANLTDLTSTLTDLLNGDAE